MAEAMASCEIPIGFRYSSRRISPGVIGCNMVIRYYSARPVSMIINDSHFLSAGVRPAKHDPPLVVDPDGVCNPAKFPRRGSKRLPGGTVRSARFLAWFIWISLRNATLAMPEKIRLFSVRKSSSVSRSAKDWIIKAGTVPGYLSARLQQQVAVGVNFAVPAGRHHYGGIQLQ